MGNMFKKAKLPEAPPPPRKSDAEILLEETAKRRRSYMTGPGTNILTGAQGDQSPATTGKASLGGS